MATDHLGFRQVHFEEPAKCRFPSATKGMELQLERHGGPGGAAMGVSTMLTQGLAMVWGASSGSCHDGSAFLPQL